MAEPFNNTSPGGETRRYADYIDPVAGEDLYAGEAVTLADGSGAAAAGEAVRLHGGDAGALGTAIGVAYINQVAGKRVTVKTRGTVVALTTSGVVAGATAGTENATPTDAAGAGELSADGDTYFVLDGPATKDDPRAGDGTQANYAEVDKL